MHWSVWFDQVLPMGLRLACYICQQIANDLIQVGMVHACRCLEHSEMKMPER